MTRQFLIPERFCAGQKTDEAGLFQDKSVLFRIRGKGLSELVVIVGVRTIRAYILPKYSSVQ